MDAFLDTFKQMKILLYYIFPGNLEKPKAIRSL